MQTNYFKNRLKKIQAKFNETFGMHPLINPKFRRTIIFAIVRLGVLESKISADFNTKDINQFKMIESALKKIFAEFDCKYDGKNAGKNNYD